MDCLAACAAVRAAKSCRLLTQKQWFVKIWPNLVYSGQQKKINLKKLKKEWTHIKEMGNLPFMLLAACVRCQSFILNVCVLPQKLQRLRCGSCLIPAANKLPLAFSSVLTPSLSAPQQPVLQSEGRTCLLTNCGFILLIVPENTFIQFSKLHEWQMAYYPVITSVEGGYDGAERRANCLKRTW